MSSVAAPASPLKSLARYYLDHVISHSGPILSFMYLVLLLFSVTVFTDRLILTGRLLLASTMVFTYPMECFVARHSLHSLLFLHAPGLVRGGAAPSVEQPEEGTGVGENDCIDDIVLDIVLEQEGKEENPRSRPLPQTVQEVGQGGPAGDEETMSALSGSQHVLFTLGLWGSSLLLALVVSDLHLILALTGAVAASFLAYILPAMLYLQTYEAHWRRARAGFDPASNHYQPNVMSRVRKLRRFVFPFCLLTFGILSLVIGVSTVVYEVIN